MFIRYPTQSDEEEFVSKVVRNREFHYPWIVNSTHASFFESFLLRFERNAEGHFVCSLQSGEILGVININDIILGALNSGFLGFYVFKPHQRKGYMSEGLQLVIRRAFKKLKLHRLEANIRPNNHPSRSFIQRHGFHKEGYSRRYLKIAGKWRDHERWALLREDWEKYPFPVPVDETVQENPA